MNLGQVIKQMRSKNALTQGELAKKADLTQSYLSQIESNSKEPNLSTLRRISEELSVPLPILFFLALDASDVSGPKSELLEEIGPDMRFLIDRHFPPKPQNLESQKEPA